MAEYTDPKIHVESQKKLNEKYPSIKVNLDIVENNSEKKNLEELEKILFDKTQNPWELIIPISGSKFNTPEPLFQKLDEEIVSMENEKITHEQN